MTDQNTAPLDLDGLERLAKAATHQSWAAFTDDSGSRPHTNLVSVDPLTDCALSIPGAHKNDPNVAFIGAMTPKKALALISQAREAERMRVALRAIAFDDEPMDVDGIVLFARQALAPATGGGE